MNSGFPHHPLQKSITSKKKCEPIPPFNLIPNDPIINNTPPNNIYHFPPINIHHQQEYHSLYSNWMFYPPSNFIHPNYIPYTNYRPITYQEDFNQLSAYLNDYKPSFKRHKSDEKSNNKTIFIEHNSSNPSSKKIIHSPNKKHNENEQKRREKISNYISKLSNFLNCKKKSTLYVLSSIEEYIRQTRHEIAEDEKKLNNLLEENKRLRLLIRQQKLNTVSH